MSGDRNKMIKIASVYAGTILGAGFASGQELLKFFVRFGAIGIVGLLVSGVLFALVGWAVMHTMVEHKTKSYDELMGLMLGKTLGKVMGVVVLLFLGILFCTMMAAGGSCVQQVFGYEKMVGIVLIALLCFVTFLFDVEGIVDINVVLCPMLMVGGIFVGVHLLLSDSVETFQHQLPAIKVLTDNWLISSIVYVSYNVITAISVLASLNGLVKNKKIAKYGAIVGGGAMCVLGIFMSLPLLLQYTWVQSLEMPMLGLVKVSTNDLLMYLYLFVLMAAIFTTAVANGFAIIQWLSQKIAVRPIYIKIAVTIGGVLLAQIGFSNFVGLAYPVFGYLGLLEMVVILLYFVKRMMRRAST